MMDVNIVVQASKVDRVDFRIISYDGDSVHVVNVHDTTFMSRDEAWLGKSRIFKGRNLRKLFNYFLKDKQYTNLYYKETWLSKTQWIEFLNDIVFYHSNEFNNVFNEMTYSHWEVEIVSPITYKQATGKILRKKYRKHHTKNEYDEIPF